MINAKNLNFFTLTAIAIFPLAACAGEGKDMSTPPNQISESSTPETPNVLGEKTEDGGVANLPYARGKVFYNLDEYLAHLEQLSAIDLPYWHEISPGVYEHVIRMPNAERETATRAELLERFGFEE